MGIIKLLQRGESEILMGVGSLYTRFCLSEIFSTLTSMIPSNLPKYTFFKYHRVEKWKKIFCFFFSAFLYLRDYIRLNLIISFKFVVITSCNRFKSRKLNDVCAKQIDFSLKNTATLVKFTFFLILQQKFYDLLNWFNLSFFIIETSASQIGGFSMCRIPKWWK